MTDEERIRRALLRGGGVAKAHELAQVLEQAGRIKEAIVIAEAALREGPDFGKGELSGVTLLDALSATWSRGECPWYPA